MEEENEQRLPGSGDAERAPEPATGSVPAPDGSGGPAPAGTPRPIAALPTEHLRTTAPTPSGIAPNPVTLISIQEPAPRVVLPAEPTVHAMANDAEVERQIRRMSRRSFLWGAAAVGTGVVGWQWLIRQRTVDGIPWPFRIALETDEQLSRDYFGRSRLAPNFPREQATEPRPNGDYGLSDDFDPATWKLHVVGLADTAQATTMTMPPPAPPKPDPKDRKATDKKASGKKGGAKKGSSDGTDTSDTADAPADSSDNSSNNGDSSSDASDNSAGSSDNGMTEENVVMLGLDAIKALPRVEMVTELKCIEGWSVVVQWAGARLADFVARYPPARNENGQLPQYVGLATPDGEYYVGLDMESALHPQTLLCYEMNGKPLPPEHGAPLRLVIPVKYGIKNIKRIGMIHFTDKRPADYWAEQGYDWYAGH